MKSTYEEVRTPENKYPMLYKSTVSGIIILAHGEKDHDICGIVLVGNESINVSVGEYYEGWSKEILKPYYGKVTIDSSGD